MKEHLKNIGASRMVVSWGEQFSTHRELWEGFKFGDWAIHYAELVGVDHRWIVAAACACVQGVIHLVPEREKRPRVALDTAIAWTQGTVTRGRAREAANDARAAAVQYWRKASAPVWRTLSMWSAAWASDAADSAAIACCEITYAGEAVRYACNAARPARERNGVRAQCADRIRKVIPWEMVAFAIGRKSC